jgi:hypothetical protein
LARSTGVAVRCMCPPMARRRGGIGTSLVNFTHYRGENPSPKLPAMRRCARCAIRQMCRPWASRTVAPEVGRVLLSFGSAPSSPAALALPIVPGAAFALPHPKHLRTSSDPPAVLAHNTRRPGSPSSASLAYRGGAMRCYKVRPELRRTIFSVNYAVTAEATGRIRIRSW